MTSEIKISILEIPLEVEEVDDFDEALSLHMMAMSDDPLTAAGGRFLKEFHPMIERYVAFERARGTMPGIFFKAVIKAALMEISSMLMTSVHAKESIPRTLEMMQDQMTADMQRVITIVREKLREKGL